ncbi:MAG: hypothetical protein ACFFG0_11115 [Candidatus Thorarchaeota archaeon]
MNFKKEKNNNSKENSKKKLHDHEFLESVKQDSLGKFPKKLKLFKKATFLAQFEQKNLLQTYQIKNE